MIAFPKAAALLLITATGLVACGSGQGAEDDAATARPIEVVKGEVPRVEDATLFHAITALREAGLRYEVHGLGYDAEDEAYNTREWHVMGQDPAAGQDADPRDTVALTVERR